MFKYIRYADLLKQIIQKKKQLKQVIYKHCKNKFNSNDKDQQSNTKSDLNLSASYSLLSLVTNNYKKLEEFVQKIQIRTNSSINNAFLLMVMTGQYINMGTIKGGGKIKKIILENIDLLPQIKVQSKINKQTIQIRVIQNIYHQKDNKQIENQDSSEKWKSLFKQKKFPKNPFVKNMYDLSSEQYKNIIKQHPNLMRSKHCVIQSFSSALPPLLLLHGVQKSNLKNFRIIDACSAPGNKTIQLGQYSHSQAFKRIVLAFQKDPKRFQILQRTISRFNSHKNIKGFHQNFLQTNPSDKRFNKVKFILLDPSCSGSGMLSNYLRDLTDEHSQVDKMTFEQFCDHQYKNLNKHEKQRVQNLHNFQLQLLNHTAKFQPQRISYSTCSIYRRQNEEVVSQFLQKNTNYILKQNKLITKSVGKYSIQQGFKDYKLCVRMDPRKRQTDGFFIAVFTKIKN